MKAAEQDRARLRTEVLRLVDQLKALGAIQVILFGSLARGEVSLFSDIDLLVLFDDSRSARHLTQWVYRQIHSSEGIDILAYNREVFERLSSRPFFRKILIEGEVLYERTATQG